MSILVECEGLLLRTRNSVALLAGLVHVLFFFSAFLLVGLGFLLAANRASFALRCSAIAAASAAPYAERLAGSATTVAP